MPEVASSEICADLMSVLNVSSKPGESAEDFTSRAVLATQKLSEDKWSELQEETQQWVNDWIESEERKIKGDDVELPLLVAEEDDNSGIPEFLQRKTNGKNKTNGKELAPAASKAKTMPEPEKETETSREEPEETGSKRQGRPPAEWSVKKVLALHNELAAELRANGHEIRDRKVLLNRAQACEALNKLQASFEDAGMDLGEDFAKALEAMGTPGKGGRPTAKKAEPKEPKLEVNRQAKDVPVERTYKSATQRLREVVAEKAVRQVPVETSYQKAQDEAVKHFAPRAKTDHSEQVASVGRQHPVIAAVLERFPKAGASEHEHDLWISVLKGSLELFA